VSVTWHGYNNVTATDVKSHLNLSSTTRKIPIQNQITLRVSCVTDIHPSLISSWQRSPIKTNFNPFRSVSFVVRLSEAYMDTMVIGGVRAILPPQNSTIKLCINSSREKNMLLMSKILLKNSIIFSF